jgi:hypothetical protein
MSQTEYQQGDQSQYAGPPGYDYRAPMRGGMGWGYGGGYGMRPSFPIETKPFFLTSEFWGAVLLIIGAAIATGSSDDMDARAFWTIATAVTIGYLLSRGIAKSGTKSRSWDPREDLMGRAREKMADRD